MRAHRQRHTLRAAGLLVEEAPAGDARRCGYRLSKAGEAFFSAASFHIMVAEEILVGPLSEAERDKLKRLCCRQFSIKAFASASVLTISPLRSASPSLPLKLSL